MAIQKCHECGKDVSTTAKACPNCGAPVKKPLLQKNVGCLSIIVSLIILLWIVIKFYPPSFDSYRERVKNNPVVAAVPAPGCDKAAAKKVMQLMKEMIQKTETDAGWVIVTFGQDYFQWTDRQTEGMVTTYANADACTTGKARKLEFRSPSGKLIARADSFRGIRME